MREYVLCVRGCGVFSYSWLVLDCWPGAGGVDGETARRDEERGKGIACVCRAKNATRRSAKSDGKKRASVSGSRV